MWECQAHFNPMKAEFNMEKSQIMSLEEVRNALRDRRLIIVAHETNLSYPTIKAILNGRQNPKYETVKFLSDYLQGVRKNEKAE
jgi:Helix-turn-helix